MGDTANCKWTEQGLEVWNHLYAPINAGNYSSVNESTLMLVEKLEREEIPLENTRRIVLQIGGTDLRHKIKVKIVHEQIKKIILLLQQSSPGVKILLLGILPRGCDNKEVRSYIKETNELLTQFENGFTIRCFNLYPYFVNPENDKVIAELYDKDGVNLSLRGYQVWAHSMAPIFEELLN